MFEIRYRLISDISYLKNLKPDELDYDLEGFFEIQVNDNSYGRYHNNPLGEYEEGDELLITWFCSLLGVCLELRKRDYVALDVIETYKLWIEFVKKDESVYISLINKEKGSYSYITSYVTCERIKEYEYDDWYGELVSFQELCNETLVKSKQFYNDLIKINPYLVENQRTRVFKDLIVELENI